LGLVSGGRALIDTTYIDNAADALVAAVDHIDAGHGRAFIVSNGQPRTVEEMVGRICAAAGVPGPSLTVPQPVAWVGGAVAEAAWKLARRTDDPPMTRFLAGQLGTAHWFDLRETERVLQWRPRVDLDEGFERLRSYYATHP
jgi:nucleoside-diphosphate-sugar epimerase